MAAMSAASGGGGAFQVHAGHGTSANAPMLNHCLLKVNAEPRDTR